MAKQIQDMPLKTGVSGNEDILIQDNGVTKRIKASELMDESTTVDLSEYYTKTEVDDLLDDSKPVDLSGYYTKTEVDDLLDGIPTHEHDNKELLDGITADAISKWSNTDASTISGYSIVVLTEEEYSALGTVDGNTIYIVVKGLE